MTGKEKGSKAFDVLINDDDIEVKSIHSYHDNIPFAFQKRDKIPLDNVEITLEKKNSVKSRTSYSTISNLSNLPFDERPVPTIYNRLKKEKEERARNAHKRDTLTPDEKRAQLSWDESIDSYLDTRPKSMASSAYDRQKNRSSMNIIAEVISASGLNSDSESDEEDEDYEIAEENNENIIVSSDDNASLEINFNNFNNNNLYPPNCIASGIEDLKSNVCQVENSSIHTSYVSQDQINRHLSQKSNSLKRTVDNRPPIVPQLTFSLVNDNNNRFFDENKLLDYKSSLNRDNSKKGGFIILDDNNKKSKKSKKSRKSKKTTPSCLCSCIIS